MESKKNKKFEKLSRDKEDKTVIIAGNEKVSVTELEKKDGKSSNIKKKLKSVEKELDKYK